MLSRKSKHTLNVQYLYTYFQKSHRLWDNVDKYSIASQATADNITRSMRFTCWVLKVTDKQSE